MKMQDRMSQQSQDKPSFWSVLFGNGTFMVLLGLLIVALIAYVAIKIYEGYKQDKIIEDINKARKEHSQKMAKKEEAAKKEEQVTKAKKEETAKSKKIDEEEEEDDEKEEKDNKTKEKKDDEKPKKE